jgi:predicted nucleotidyltransferase
MDLFPDLTDLLAVFADGGVEFVLIGGYAVSFHARPRATKDLDLLLAGDGANLARAADALEKFGAPSQVVAACRTMGASEVVYMGQPPMRVDLLRTIDGVDIGGVFSRAVEAQIAGSPVRVISIEDLIANKRAADRPQDRIDVSILEGVLARRGGSAG